MPGMDQLMGERRGTGLEELTHHPIRNLFIQQELIRFSIDFKNTVMHISHF